MADRANLLTDVPGVRVGNAEDEAAATGVTVVVFDRPAVASVSIQGGAPGGRDVSLLEPEMSVPSVDALVLSGGSAFGLDAAGGVLDALGSDGRGFAVGSVKVPIACQAILFDLLNGGEKRWLDDPGHVRAPYWDLGRAATWGAGCRFSLGTAGAGYGATTADLKGGLGSASVRLASGHWVAALVAVNAVGSALIGDGPHFWAGAWEDGDEYGGLGWPSRVSDADRALRFKGEAPPSTSIGVVATDAVLGKAECKRLAVMAHDGLARAVRPAHAPMDGDTLFAAATARHPGPVDMTTLTRLGAAAADCVARAVARGVYEARALPCPGALPAWRDRFGG